MKKWQKFNEKDLKYIVETSRSYRQVAIKCGYGRDSGSSQKSIREMIKYYQFNTTHFTGQAWNHENYDMSRFVNGRAIKSSEAVSIISTIRGHQCENCGLKLWNNELIPLELHHKDGDRLNNELENVELWCPNCHAQTNNYCGKNINSGVMKVSDDDFIKALDSSPNIRQALMKLGLTPKGGNYTRAYELLLKRGKTWGVSLTGKAVG